MEKTEKKIGDIGILDGWQVDIVDESMDEMKWWIQTTKNMFGSMTKYKLVEKRYVR